MKPIWFSLISVPGSFDYCRPHCMLWFTQQFIAHHQLWLVFGKAGLIRCLSFRPQGFTYVAPSVLENVKEKFSFEPKVRSPRKFPGSPRTPVRWELLLALFWAAGLQSSDVWFGSNITIRTVNLFLLCAWHYLRVQSCELGFRKCEP